MKNIGLITFNFVILSALLSAFNDT